jgi:hypothetical protein
MQELLHSAVTEQETDKRNYLAVFALMFLAVLSYAGVVWSLVQPMINPAVFIIALSVSVVSSVALGRLIQR